MKRKMKKLNKKKLLFFILILILVVYLRNLSVNFDTNPFFNLSNHSGYKTIKQDKNDKYLGVGQQWVDNQDGYFTTFTTIEQDKKTYKEYKQNGNASWVNLSYWGGTMAENGCGITSLAIILSGYNKNYTPESLRKKYAPVLDYNNMSQELEETFGIENSDFYYDRTHLAKDALREHLETNRPILICVWNKPSENRWTTSSHYMVLLATDGEDMVYVSNPNRP